MTDIMTSDVYRFIEWINDMPGEIGYLAHLVIGGNVDDSVAGAKWCEEHRPDDVTEYDFIGCLAGSNVDDPIALMEEATRELVADFYAAHPRWISVEDRLPDHYTEVLATDGTRVFESLCNTNTGRFALTADSDDVTHWMPTPAPPEAP